MNTAVNQQLFQQLTEDDQTRLLALLAQERAAGANGHYTAALPGTSGDSLVAPTWQIRTLADAYSPRPPVTYLVEKVIPQGSLFMLFGAPGSFKSMVMADMAVCLAGGRSWLPLPDGSGGRKTTAMPVFWVDCDNGRRRTDERFDALAKARDLPASTPFSYVSMPNPALNLADVTSAMLLTDHVRHYQAGLVVLDNLGLISGKADENSGEMASVMANLRALTEDTGATVALIHHQRKTSDKEQQINVIRGHSSIAASLDLAIHVSRDSSASTTGVVMIPVKMRDADIPILGAEFAYKHVEGRDGELETARFFSQQVVDTKSTQAIRRAVLEALYGGKVIKQSDLVKEVKAAGITAGQNAIRDVIEGMSGKGELNESPGANNAKLYSLA